MDTPLTFVLTGIRVAHWCSNDRETNTDSNKTHVLQTSNVLQKNWWEINSVKKGCQEWVPNGGRVSVNVPKHNNLEKEEKDISSETMKPIKVGTVLRKIKRTGVEQEASWENLSWLESKKEGEELCHLKLWHGLGGRMRQMRWRKQPREGWHRGVTPAGGTGNCREGEGQAVPPP